MKQIHIQKDDAFIPLLKQTLADETNNSSWDTFTLAYEAARATMNRSFNELKAPTHLPDMAFLPYQLETAKHVLFRMHGRAILADEVGLGKTIEAGLILKEYLIRGLVKKALILVPASLVQQWVDELQSKFNIQAVAYRKNYNWEEIDIIVCSLDMAKKAPHAEVIQSLEYDFLLVDEAHRLKNAKTLNHLFVRSIQKTYCLLLTATPIQNKLSEIYHLITILRPGLLGNYQSFIDTFEENKQDQQDILQKLLKQVLIRNTRKDIQGDDIKRLIDTTWMPFTDEEQAVYERIEQLTADFPPFTRLTLLRALCSSREACFLSIEKMLTQDDHPHREELAAIAEEIAQLPHHVKAKQLVNYIESVGSEKVIVFTEFRATQFYLQWYLDQHGITSVPFRGGFKSSKKEWMRELFKNQAQVLIATEAGGEGINLQFCHHMINYDLPWNPMKIEQRIGRIHRFGQQQDVHITHFAIQDTLEEHLLHILYHKIDLFERVIGDVDDILSHVHVGEIDQQIQRILHTATSDDEVKEKLEQLTTIIEQTDHEEVEHRGSD